MTVLAAVLVAAVVFGVWAAVTGNSGVFGRLTGLAGVFSLMLVVVVAAIGVLLWAQHPPGIQLPAPEEATVPVAPPDRSGQVSMAGPVVVVGNVPQQPPAFQPRSDLMAELDDAGPGVSVVHAVTGMPGVGKTQLAAAYARAKLAAGWRLVAWVNAEDPARVLAGLAAVTEAAGLARQVTGGDASQVVRRWLETDGDRRLVVFDDATDADALRPCLPARGAARVLIITNSRSVASLGTPVGVEVLTADEALAFLADRTGRPDPAGAEAVAAELGYLPLALAQAAAVIAGQHLSYMTYLEQLKALPVTGHLAGEPDQPDQPYPPGAAAARLSLEAVRAADPGEVCTGVLELMSVLSAAGIRRDLLYAAGQAGMLSGGPGAGAGAGVGVDAVYEALGQLAERSLLSFSLNGRVVIAHRLVLRVVRDQLAREERLVAACRGAAAVLEAWSEELAGSPDRLAVRDVPEQVAALRDVVAGFSAEPGAELARALLRLQGWALYHLNALGDSGRQAIVIGEQLIADQERVLGPDHSDTLAARNNLANAYQAAGRTDEAIALHERTLADRERVLGPDHSHTVQSRNNLAASYQAAGRTEEAIALHEQAPADLMAIALGEQAPADLTAIALHEQVLAVSEQALGAGHPDTLAARNNLAVAYQTAGRTAEAIALHEQALADRERVLGPDHPGTLNSRSNLAVAYQAAGRTDEAIALHEEVLAARERVLGPDHPDTQASRNNLASAHRVAGRAN